MKIFTSVILFVFLMTSSNEAGLVKRGSGLFLADGTLWCGGGNKAESCDDLGTNSDTDKCCREHDYCPFTFSSQAPSYNGYSINDFKPLLHCDCDIIFSDCLLAKPYKRGSYLVYSSYFEELNMKCFAYLPCNNQETDEFNNIWDSMKDRRTGTCHENMRVAVFDSIYDYRLFMNSNVTRYQKEIVKEAMETRVESFMSGNKKQAPCVKIFPDNPANLVKNFESVFLQTTTTTTVTTTTTATTTTVKPITKNTEISKSLEEKNNIILYGYVFSFDYMLLILVGVLLLIPGILFVIFIAVKKINKALNHYLFIKNTFAEETKNLREDL